MIIRLSPVLAAAMIAISGLPAKAEVPHRPHAFDFEYEDEMIVVEGVVRGTWFGHSHSAVFIEPIEETEEAPASDTDSADEVITPEELTPDAQGTASVDVFAGPIPGPDPIPMVEEELLTWEVETYPRITLERAGWAQDILVEGDLVLVAMKPSRSVPMHGQLLGITRVSDGWTGLGHALPDGLDMEQVLLEFRETQAEQAFSENSEDSEFVFPGQLESPRGDAR